MGDQDFNIGDDDLDMPRPPAPPPSNNSKKKHGSTRNIIIQQTKLLKGEAEPTSKKDQLIPAEGKTKIRRFTEFELEGDVNKNPSKRDQDNILEDSINFFLVFMKNYQFILVKSKS